MNKYELFSIEKLRKQRMLAESLAQLTLKKKDSTNPNICAEIDTTRKFASGDKCISDTDSRKSCTSSDGVISTRFIPLAENLEISTAVAVHEKEDHILKSSEPVDYKWENMNWKMLTNGSSNQQSFQAHSFPTPNADEECLEFEPEQVEYLQNLRREFQDMPVMMFYNIVRLWHVQQKMLSETSNPN